MTTRSVGENYAGSFLPAPVTYGIGCPADVRADADLR